MASDVDKRDLESLGSSAELMPANTEDEAAVRCITHMQSLIPCEPPDQSLNGHLMVTAFSDHSFKIMCRSRASWIRRQKSLEGLMGLPAVLAAH